MTFWFTSDSHFNHDNIIKYSKRPFSTLAEMEQSMIANWNGHVARGDLVYHLGDFALSWGVHDARKIDGLLAELNGTKILIVGNHDRNEVTSNRRWAAVHQLHEIKVDIKSDVKQRIVLCHYPLRVWNRMHHGAWMLHGHSHGSLEDVGGKVMDVGVDCHCYRPISIDEVTEFMNSRQFVAMDHHSSDR